MAPDTPSSQPAAPATLPALSMPPQAIPMQAPASAVPADQPPLPAAQAAPLPPQADIALQAEQLVNRLGNDPHQLANAVAQLKAGYLAQYHHIVPNQTGS